ncbi:MAG: tyrosine--tRNA ligase [Clostridia bacterium]|nr:tyrosine--tRNA ligase [Clostridia bacterium]
MFYRVDKKILETAGGLFSGVLLVEGINNSENNQAVSDLLEKEVISTKEYLKDVSIKEMKELDCYRNALKAYNINSSKYPCSIEAILTRIAKKGEFPSISPIVDICNYVSIKYKVPVGVHDMDSLDNDLVVRLSIDSDCENEDNNIGSDVLKIGEPVYVCGNVVRTRRWMWRQMPAGRVDEKSKNFIIPIDGFESNKSVVLSAVDELAKLIEEHFGVKAYFEFIEKNNPEIRFGQMSDEEKKVENQIAIMLKGVAQHTAVSEIREKINTAIKENRPLRIKLGLDPSAPDIHLGHSVVLRKIRQLQDLGHKAIIIIGDYTGMIGDPTGKSKTRKQLSREDVERNADTYMEQIFKIIDKSKTEVYYNSEWLSKMNFGDVIELAAKCTVARMLERDDFNNRYTNHLPLSVHEFFYPLMQAYDSVAVKADIELGGTDQTFNILMGRNIQKDYGQTPQLTLFMPLLEGIDGVEKMSKSLGNYIGISEPAEIIYEKIMKIPDSLIIKYYNLCTDVHPSEVDRLQAELDQGTNPRDIKMLLAHEITRLYAGEEAAVGAEEHFKQVFQNNLMPDDAPELHIVSDDSIPDGEQIISELVNNGYYKSKSEVRRVFAQGGAQIDGVRITDIKTISITEKNSELKMGKAKFYKIVRD